MTKRVTMKGWLAKTGGLTLVLVGLAFFVLGFATDIHFAGVQPMVLMLGGGQAMMLGVLLRCYHQLLIRAIPTEQGLMHQYDMGYEQGWRECTQYNSKASLVDLDEFRARHEAINTR